MVYSNKNKDGYYVFVDCDCGCGNSIKLTKYNHDEDYFLNVCSLDFYSKQLGLIKTIIHRLKLIGLIILGKEYRMTSIILKEEDIKDIAKELKHISSKQKQILLENEVKLNENN